MHFLPDVPGPLLIAHRGESRDAPENTLAAIRLAWDRGARAVEIDVRMSADDELMVIHDADTRRVGGPRRAVRLQTAGELEAIDAGVWKHPRWRGERIPRLSGVLDTVPAGGRLFIELKEGPHCVAPLREAIARCPRGGTGLVIMSFDEATVAEAARTLRVAEHCLLRETQDYSGPAALARSIERARELGCRSLNVEAHRRLDARMVSAVHSAGLRLHVWTVNGVAIARRLALAGVDGITTDRCAWLREKLAARA